MEDASLPQFRCQTCLGLQAGPPCRLFMGSAPAVAFSVRNSILSTLLVVLLKPDCWLSASFFKYFQLLCKHRLACKCRKHDIEHKVRLQNLSGPFLRPKTRSKRCLSNCASPVATALGFNLTVESECVFKTSSNSTKRRNSRPSGPSRKQESRSPRNFNTLSGRAHVFVCTVCGCTYCSNNCIVTP